MDVVDRLIFLFTFTRKLSCGFSHFQRAFYNRYDDSMESEWVISWCLDQILYGTAFYLMDKISDSKKLEK